MNRARQIIEVVQHRELSDTHGADTFLITEEELSDIEMLLTQIAMICDDEYVYKSNDTKVAAIKSMLEDYA